MQSNSGIKLTPEILAMIEAMGFKKVDEKIEKSEVIMTEAKFPHEDCIITKKVKQDGTVEITGIRANVISDYLLEHNKLLYATAPNGDKGRYYIYDASGCYKPSSDKEIKKIIKDFLVHYNYDCIVTPHNIKNISELMDIDIPRINYDDLDADETIINFKNGVLDLETMILHPHNPGFYSSTQIPVNWTSVPQETPVFDKFMDDLTCLHEDKEDVKQLLMEFIGVSISNIYGWRYKTSLLLFGNGSTGKTQLRNLVVDLIGRQNTATLELKDLDKDFTLGNCYGKRLFGSDDMGFGKAKDIETFKTITGGGTVNVNAKYKDSFSAILRGVFWNNANALPLFGGDKGDHVYGRIMPVRCDNVIPEHKRDSTILSRMLDEAEGIVYKAVMAMLETVKRGYKYIKPESVIKDMQVYKKENNICIEFYEEYCIPEGYGERRSQAEVRRCFSNWAKINYGAAPKKDEFEKSIASYLGLTTDEIKRRTSSVRAYIFDISAEAVEEYMN